jgi:hypothetical protein
LTIVYYFLYITKFREIRRITVVFFGLATVAQLVEQLICNHQVAGSTPAAGTIIKSESHIKSGSQTLMSKHRLFFLRSCLIVALLVPACLLPSPSFAQDEGLTFEQAQTRTAYARRQMEAKRQELKDAAAGEEKALRNADDLKKRYEDAVKAAQAATQAREDADKAFNQAREHWTEESARLKRIYDSRQ